MGTVARNNGTWDFDIQFLNTYLPAYKDSLFLSSFPLYHGKAAILISSFALVTCMIWYLVVGEANNFNLQATGIHQQKATLANDFGSSNRSADTNTKAGECAPV